MFKPPPLCVKIAVGSRRCALEHTRLGIDGRSEHECFILRRDAAEKHDLVEVCVFMLLRSNLESCVNVPRPRKIGSARRTHEAQIVGRASRVPTLRLRRGVLTLMIFLRRLYRTPQD
jgi:hypothetical protein